MKVNGWADYNLHDLFGRKRRCAWCGKEFYADMDYVYKIRERGKSIKKAKWFCRWDHQRAWEKRHQ